MAGAVRIGCSGWMYRDWKESFYEGVPQKRWLERYAEEFDTVELNTTFYRLAKPETVAEWVRRTPDGFLFAAKASRYRGYVRPSQSGPIELSVHLPAGVGPNGVTTWAGKTRVENAVKDGVVVFTIPGRAGRASDWAVSW